MNRTDTCGPCAVGGKHLKAAPKMMPEFWELPAIQDALHSKQIGNLFRAYRRSRRPIVTQTQLATWLGLPRSYVSDLERGTKRATNIERLKQWCDALNVPYQFR